MKPVVKSMMNMWLGLRQALFQLHLSDQQSLISHLLPTKLWLILGVWRYIENMGSHIYIWYISIHMCIHSNFNIYNLTVHVLYPVHIQCDVTTDQFHPHTASLHSNPPPHITPHPHPPLPYHYSHHIAHQRGRCMGCLCCSDSTSIVLYEISCYSGPSNNGNLLYVKPNWSYSCLYTYKYIHIYIK